MTRRQADGQLKEARVMLENAGVPGTNIRSWIGVFNSITRKHRFNQHWGSVRKRLQKDSTVWSVLFVQLSDFLIRVAIADVDEFPFLNETLPARLHRLELAGYNVLAGISGIVTITIFVGITVDRVAADGSMRPYVLSS